MKRSHIAQGTTSIHRLHGNLTSNGARSSVSVRPKWKPSSRLCWSPKGLFYLAATEAWERFSYYGMTALVVLYMVNQLLLPGHVQHILGFSGFKAAVESAVGPALASQIFGLYSGFVYFTPLLGGMIADRWDRTAQCCGNRRSLDECRSHRHGV